MTTFARIAKILKGLVEPRNWVEEAFAEIEGGDSAVEVVNFTVDGDDVHADKTVTEIYESSQNGKTVIGNIMGRLAFPQSITEYEAEFCSFFYNRGNPGNLGVVLLSYDNHGILEHINTINFDT